MNNSTNPTTRTPAKMHCPICKQQADEGSKFFPFCSKRCQTIDLGRWADESYKITRPIEMRDMEEGVD